MRRILTLTVVAALLTLVLSSCGGDDDVPAVSNQSPFVGEKFTLSGQVDADGARAVSLESYDEGWNEVDKAKSTADGAYEFTTSSTEPSMRYRVVAAATQEHEKHITAPVTVATVDDAVSLSVIRTGGRKGVAIGEGKVLQAGRNFELQWLDGRKWKKLGSAEADKSGRTKIPFDVTGDRFYRLVGEVIKGTEGATSPAMPFTRGPAKLGKNVVYVNVDENKAPVIKGTNYEANAVLVSDGVPSKPLRLDEFAVRGNSTADKIKKPYKVKFKKNRRPFNLPEDKTWVLLANFNDHSLIRTQLGYTIGAGLDALRWTPRSAFTELFVNGEYKGSYQLSESIKIDKNRIDISQKKGVVIEVDKHYNDPPRVPGFFGDHQIPYAFKDPDERKKGKEEPEGITNDKVASMKSRILDFEKVLYGTDFKDPENGWQKYLDLDAAVDYYLVKEYTKENDGDFYRSTFFHTADYTDTSSKFFMGPVWDFDRSAGAKPEIAEGATTTVARPTGWWLRGNSSPNHSTSKTHWYVQLSKDPVFIEAVKKRWAEKRGFFKDIADNGVDRMAKGVRTAADNDRRLLGNIDTSYLDAKRLKARSTTFAGEIAFLKDWYQKRFAWMDSKLS